MGNAGDSRRSQAKDRALTPAARPQTVRATVALAEVIVGHPPDPLYGAIFDGLEDAKAEDVVSIDLRGKTTLADRMFIATGRSTTHVNAIADRVIKACRQAGFPTPRIEGMPVCDWVLLDARDAIVHIFRPEVRQFYNLEKMWSADRPGEPSKA